MRLQTDFVGAGHILQTGTFCESKSTYFGLFFINPYPADRCTLTALIAAYAMSTCDHGILSFLKLLGLQ